MLSTSPPINPSCLPFPLWGPFFISLTSSFMTWAITPLSLVISIFLSFLVGLNVTLYIIYYRLLKLGARKGLVASLGLIATSLSCSCELFTGLISSAAVSLPFLFSISFMDRLSESLVILAISLLTLSTFVLYNEVNGKNPFPKSIKSRTKLSIAAVIILVLTLIPPSPAFSLVRIIGYTFAGGLIASALLKKESNKVFFPISVSILVGEIIAFPLVYNSIIVLPISLLAGILGELGFRAMKKWARLGIMHVTAWTMIMPGPISLILGYPIPFFNFSFSQLLQIWIYTWIIGTPIAWYAGIYYLQYLRDSMSEINLERIRINVRETPGLTWIILGTLTLLTQIAFFITHVCDYVDYNGFDYDFLVEMTLITTSLMIAGLVSLSYGIYEIIKFKFNPPKVSRKDFKTFTLIYAIINLILGGIVHFDVNGFPYPHFYVFMFGMPLGAPSVLIYYPPFIGIEFDPLKILQLLAVSIMGGYIISAVKLYYASRRQFPKGGLSSLALGAIGICPQCAISAYATALLSFNLGFSALYSFSSQLILSLTADSLLFASVLYIAYKLPSVCRINIKK
ncbi:hypothetical protein [Acidianus ambivalens]|uniref:Uncharacterized protein n=1 Tax=Acidianus ambivalens TaxID=2283 RepID=A0A650CTX2_ACIAM|nr:hypothetical protein [Acidianus ambivalens]MQL56219.1 hypothetical protein [Acidianus ambivalens]QGR21243.1 hypothetical protein D1866_03930 [Acidianus ambivalens]